MVETKLKFAVNSEAALSLRLTQHSLPFLSQCFAHQRYRAPRAATDVEQEEALVNQTLAAFLSRS